MKKVTILSILVYFILCSCSSPQTQTLDLPGVWKFKTGDSADYANPTFDDSSWDTLRAGKIFEMQGFDKYDGIAWYRMKIQIPSSMKNGLSASYSHLFIQLGRIDDADQAYFNGHLIGSTGSMDKDDDHSYTLDRRYLIKPKIVNWDGENIIAVKVRDYKGGGGMYTGPYNIHTAGITDYVVFKQDVLSETGVFAKGEEIKYQVNIQNRSAEKVKGHIRYIISRDTHEELQSQDVPYSVNANDSAAIGFTCQVQEPGFYQINYLCSANQADSAYVDSTWFGYDPASLHCSASKPADFDEYWVNAKKELASVKPSFTMTLNKEWSTERVTVYEVEMYSLGNVRVGGWYSVPKKMEKGKKYPALLRHIGYSGSNMPIQDRPEFVCLSFNIRGHGNSKKDVDPGFPQYIAYNLHDRNNYIYRGAYMDCIRAVDFLCSRPEVDTAKIAVYGGSQGGALSFATAALDSRVDLCAPHIPFLSDFRHYFRIVSFPRQFIDDYRKTHTEITDEHVYSTLDYIDVRNLTPWIHVPVFMGVGLIDRICPPHINFVAFNNVACEDKQWFVFKKHGHGVPASQHKAELEWIKMKFNMSE